MPNEFRDLFVGNENNPKLADMLEAKSPCCACENVSVGTNSPGAVKAGELLHRILCSPRDYDPVARKILERPFRKAYQNGLSVWRALGSVDDVRTLMEESLFRSSATDNPKQISGVLEASADAVREVVDDADEKCFCVYDQTVSRLDLDAPPVPTHAGVFQRMPLAGTTNRSAIQKDIAGRLRELFEKTLIDPDTYLNGFCVDLNARARTAQFVRTE